jgi:hypothetical protein
MKKIRRDVLKRKVEKGLMLARTEYSYDGRCVTQDSEWIPARLSQGYGDFKEGFYNLRGYQFEMKSGYATVDENRIISMHITQNHYVQLKEVT